jgi:hypothetical protein
MGRGQFRAGRAEVMVSYGKRYALRSLTVSEGMGRASSARLTGMDRRTLRDGVHRDNAEGIAGLCNRPTRGRKPKLTEGQTPVLKTVVLPGPDPAVLLSQRRAQLRRNGFRPIGISSARPSTSEKYRNLLYASSLTAAAAMSIREDQHSRAAEGCRNRMTALSAVLRIRRSPEYRPVSAESRFPLAAGFRSPLTGASYRVFRVHLAAESDKMLLISLNLLLRDFLLGGRVNVRG